MEVVNDVPGLPRAAFVELQEALQRTGQTPALLRASKVLPTLLNLSPEEVEKVFYKSLQETS